MCIDTMNLKPNLRNRGNKSCVKVIWNTVSFIAYLHSLFDLYSGQCIAIIQGGNLTE